MSLGETMLIYAPAGGQKSMVALHLAAAVASGGEFLGRQASHQRVLFVDGELSEHSFAERLGTFGKPEGLDLHSECFQPVEGLAKAEWKPVRIEDSEWQDAFVSLVQQKQYKLVIFDNVRTLTAGINENEAAAISPINAFIRRLRHLDCAVAVVHHSRKADAEDGATVYAGSTNFLTIYDIAIGIERVGDNGITFDVVKDRGRSVADYFREGSWRLSIGEGGGYTRYDHYSAEYAAGRELLAEIDAGEYVSKEAIYAAAKQKHGLRWSNGNNRLRGLHEKLVDIDATEESFAVFSDRVKIGTDAGKADSKFGVEEGSCDDF